MNQNVPLPNDFSPGDFRIPEAGLIGDIRCCFADQFGRSLDGSPEPEVGIVVSAGTAVREGKDLAGEGQHVFEI